MFRKRKAVGMTVDGCGAGSDSGVQGE